MILSEQKSLLKGLDPILCEQPKILIVGSMPSVSSLDKQEYYGYAHNRFWKIMAAYMHQEFYSYQDKINALQAHDVLLWDVIGSCERIGSLDSNIRNAKCNDLHALVLRYPSLTCVLCNGKKSYTLYEQYFANKIALPCESLPSTSNANRSIKEAEIFDLWHAALLRWNVRR